MTNRFAVLGVLAAAVASRALAQDRPPIRDNSFLVEEAYNQESRVVQHISVLALTRHSSDWEYGFTQEWPVGSQRHQLSVTIPVLNAADATGVGDIALNYRYQLAFDDESGEAVAPRLSLILPTGDADRGRGTSSLGVQVNLPVSFGLHRSLVTHWNVGGTWTPSARAASGGRDATLDVAAAASVIWLVGRKFNLMLEAAWAREDIASASDGIDPGALAETTRESAWLSPGLRAAIDFSSGLQIVPGLAFPIAIRPSDGERRVLFYLSFEHGF
jgi:Putative MetA-pathway of phenol degradation